MVSERYAQTKKIGKYIKFFNQVEGFIPGVKYKVTDDSEHYYVGKNRFPIKKTDRNKIYEIGDIVTN